MTREDKVNEILETATQMVLAGTLLKNVKKHFTNLGITDELSTKIVRIAELRANELKKYKAK